MIGSNISIGHHQFKVMGYDDAKNLHPLENTSNLVESGGRKFHVFQAETQTKGTSFFKALVFCVKHHDFSHFNEVWHGRKEKINVAVGLLGKDVTRVAVQLKLIPELISDRTAKSLWPQEAAPVYTSMTEPFKLITDVIQESIEKGNLVDRIFDRQAEIRSQRKTMEQPIALLKQEDHLHDAYALLENLSDTGRMRGLEGGAGGAYLLFDDTWKPEFIVKPNDEDIFALNNRKGLATPFSPEEHSVRDDIPMYESAQNEALSYLIAQDTGLTAIAPETVMVIIKNNNFHCLADKMGESSIKFAEALSRPDERTKLCSAQRFVADSLDLQEYAATLGNPNTPNYKGPIKFDRADFEMANLFTWITGDQDGHSGNYRVIPPPEGRENEGVKIRKIDNGLTFGTGPGPIVNGLARYEGQMNIRATNTLRNKIMNIPLDKIVDQMRLFKKSEGSIKALQDRVHLLQDAVAKDDFITLKQLDDLIQKNYGGDKIAVPKKPVA